MGLDSYKVIDAENQLEARKKFDVLLDELRINSQEVIHINVEICPLDES